MPYTNPDLRWKPTNETMSPCAITWSSSMVSTCDSVHTSLYSRLLVGVPEARTSALSALYSGPGRPRPGRGRWITSAFGYGVLVVNGFCNREQRQVTECQTGNRQIMQGLMLANHAGFNVSKSCRV